MNKKKSKITILFPYLGNSIGGSHISSLLLLKNLPHPYYPLVLLHQRGDLEYFLKENNIPFIVKEDMEVLSNGILSYLRCLGLYTELIKQKKINIVHTNEINTHLAWLLPAFFSNVKHLWHQRTPGPNKSIFFSFLSSKVVTISSYCKNSFNPFLRRRMEVVFNPFNFQENDGNFLDKKQINPINIGWIGNFHKRKRLDIFIKLISILEKEPSSPSIAANIFGKQLEPEFSISKEMILKYNLKSKVLFHGFVNDVDKVYRKIDILIAPAEKEAFGRTLVEGTSYGVPVIANKEGGHIEIIKDGKTGFLISKNNIEQYVETILILVKNNTERSRIVKNGYRFCKKRFSIDVHVNNMLKIYNALNG